MFKVNNEHFQKVLQYFAGNYKKAPKAFFEFANAILAHVAIPERAHIPDQDLIDLVEGFWQHSQVRSPQTPKVRLYTRLIHGTDITRTVLQMTNDDMPFLLDSTLALLRRHKYLPSFLLHPVLLVHRNAQGEIDALGSGKSSANRLAVYESFIHIELDEVLSQAQQHTLLQGLTNLLNEIRSAVGAWGEMRQVARDIPGTLNTLSTEDQEFLRWLTQDNFTFLGYRSYTLTGKQARLEKALGISHNPRQNLGFAAEPQAAFNEKNSQQVWIGKAAQVSVVHKEELIDLIEVLTFDKHKKTAQLHQFLGLFTTASYHRPVKEIPILRVKVQSVFVESGLQPQWHGGKLLTYFLNNFPRHTLFHIRDEDLLKFSAKILNLHERWQTQVLLHMDITGQVLSCVLYIPKQNYNEKLKIDLIKTLESYLGGTVVASYLGIGEEAYAWVHFNVLKPEGSWEKIDLVALKKLLLAKTEFWEDKLRDSLITTFAAVKGNRLYKIFANAFESNYQEKFGLEQAIEDVRVIDALLARGEDAVAFHVGQGDNAKTVLIRVFHAHSLIPLSTILPIIENLGLRVLNEEATLTWLHNGRLPMHIQVLKAETEDGQALDVELVAPRLVTCLERVWENELDNDGFNKLIIHAHITCEEVQVLRAYARYMRQIQVPFSQNYIEDTLLKHATITQRLSELFHRRLAPEMPKIAKSFIADLKKAIATVDTSDEERILGLYLKLIMSTVRTNFYLPSVDGQVKPYVSFKLDARKIEELPLPRPMYEIYVYSRFMEAVHLRGGPVARGGIRHSDRKEDYRTEILGLLKAQMPKNSIIVPVGAKGGFIVKGRETPEEVIRAYQTMIRGMLDITDNLIDNKVVHPLRTRCYDDDDPYLVVAADKGTATFSDIANELALAYGFWLGDAFASGGSNGYDHKKMGITAQGAWEAVRRHFYALGMDINTKPFTVVGVGDMSGDVYGNGMLQSNKIKLVGAFNHRHIFVDPTPDPAISFEERQRLFNLPKSAWTDYDLTKASKGAQVYNRQDKELVLTKEIKQLLGLNGDTLSPNDLIRHLLLASVDMLFFGGIGTFVKSARETHSEVGDRANDLVRVDGQQLRCRIVAEGANLGCTQKGRIDFALKGGLINTDFVDNAGGVNCSDHEVNLKILLNHLAQVRKLSPKERNKLLREMTSSVAELVLRDNFQQALGLQINAATAPQVWEMHLSIIQQLEQDGRLNRQLENLPDDETLYQRAAAKSGVHGLTAPELAVLMAYTKNTLQEALVAAASLPKDLTRDDFLGYFPPQIIARFPEEVWQHRLQREITATVIASLVVNRMGIAFIPKLQYLFPDVTLDKIVSAFLFARQVFQLETLWGELEKMKTPFEVQMRVFSEVRSWVEKACEALLRYGLQSLSTKQAQLIEVMTMPLPAERVIGKTERYQQRLEQASIPSTLVTRLMQLRKRVDMLEMLLLAHRYSQPIEVFMPVYTEAIERLGLNWAWQNLQNLPATTNWHKHYYRDLEEELRLHCEQIVGRVLEKYKTLEAWTEELGEHWGEFQQLLGRLKNSPGVDAPMMGVFVSHLSKLAAMG